MDGAGEYGTLKLKTTGSPFESSGPSVTKSGFFRLVFVGLKAVAVKLVIRTAVGVETERMSC